MDMLIGGAWRPAASGRSEEVAGGRPRRHADGLVHTDGELLIGGTWLPRSAVAEMTDTKTVILHGRPW